MHYIHFSALSARRSLAERQHPMISRRLQNRHQVAVFRTASLILAGGWLLLLLGACQSESASSQEQLILNREWEAAARRWQAADKAWQQKRAREDSRNSPFRLVGTVLRTVPDGVGLDRLHVRPMEGEEGRPLAITLEGSCPGHEASPEFRDWVRSLQYRRMLATVDNLRFQRGEDGIEFHLSGRSHPGGEP